MPSGKRRLVCGACILALSESSCKQNSGVIVYCHFGQLNAYCEIIISSRRGQLYGEKRDNREKRIESSLTSLRTILTLNGDEGK